MHADDFPPLACKANFFLVDDYAEIGCEEIFRPVIMVAAEEVQLGTSLPAFGEGLKNIEVVFGDRGAVLEVEIEDISQQYDDGSTRCPAQERDEKFSSLHFARCVQFLEVGV